MSLPLKDDSSHLIVLISLGLRPLQMTIYAEGTGDWDDVTVGTQLAAADSALPSDIPAVVCALITLQRDI